MVECRTPEREVGGSKPTTAVLCPWARHFTPRQYWLITQEVVAPSRHDWKIVDWDVKPQHNQPLSLYMYIIRRSFDQLFRTIIKLCGKSVYFISPLVLYSYDWKLLACGRTCVRACLFMCARALHALKQKQNTGDFRALLLMKRKKVNALVLVRVCTSFFLCICLCCKLECWTLHRLKNVYKL